MTKDQDPFQVVLIDLQKAANHEIYCVKKPLTDQLNYVAISYRWGELQEFIIDTQVGYSASIKSFDIQDFYHLCSRITKDPSMASMEYVWVDTICVNQSNRVERKATIYRMSDIYEHASWILAVPDLHAEHLKAMHQNEMAYVQTYQDYLYHLIDGNTNLLQMMDTCFLNQIGVPEDSDLRHLLTKYTESFAEGFMTPVTYNYFYDHVYIIEHLYNNNKSDTAKDRRLRTLPHIKTPHQCDKTDCPLDYFHDLSKVPPSYRSGEWGRLIIERRTAIQHAMDFLTALVVDWSSRAWVISEFHISKKKNNLKFWCNQFNTVRAHSFFTFDIHDPRFTRIQNINRQKECYGTPSNPVHITFYQRLIHQLNRQTFLEMMLKSKASKHEDRFHAVFPIFPEYKHLLQTEALDNMNSIVDVKLKLYNVMTNEHKLLLLYLSSKGTTTSVLPTFATSAIDWPEPDKHVELIHTVHITLCQDTLGHYLRVKPTKYAIKRDRLCLDLGVLKTLHRLLPPETLRIVDGLTFVDVVPIYDTEPMSIVLIGSFIENTWIVGNEHYDIRGPNTVEDLADDFPGFRVF